MIESIEHVVIGAGPGGLRAAQVLAGDGREVVVFERNAEIGPKTCAGGLSNKAARELESLGLPPTDGRRFVAQAAFRAKQPVVLDDAHAIVRTISRRVLGAWQAKWAREAGAEVRTCTAATRFDLEARTLVANGRMIRYEHLIGADGSSSRVRRALKLPTPRRCFAAEFNLPHVRADRLLVEFDSPVLANGYFWIFPHSDYTSIGAGVHASAAPPNLVRPYLEDRLAAMGIDPGGTPFEGATVETDFVGFDFAHGVHLVGDAAGVASGLTAEGIYAALITGEEVARRILDPAYDTPKTRAWLRMKRLHDTLGALWLRRVPRDVCLSIIAPLCRVQPTKRWLSAFFLEG